MTRTVNGTISVTGKAGGLPDRQPAEEFCVGHDNRVPLDKYDCVARFTGSIELLKVVAGQ